MNKKNFILFHIDSVPVPFANIKAHNIEDASTLTLNKFPKMSQIAHGMFLSDGNRYAIWEHREVPCTHSTIGG